MSSIEAVQWKHELLNIKVWSIKIGKEYYFFGREVALALEYADPKDAIQNLVDFENKKSVEEILGENYKFALERIKLTGGKLPPVDFIQKIRTNQKLITELGLYSICTKSRKPKAKPFQKWIHKTIMDIRETGSYTLPGGPVENPLDLIAKVSYLEEEIQTLKRETKTCDKATQTPQNNRLIEKSLDRVEKEIRRAKSEYTKSIRKISISSSDSSDSTPRHYSSDSE